jgi:hypothetical protein
MKFSYILFFVVTVGIIANVIVCVMSGALGGSISTSYSAYQRLSQDTLHMTESLSQYSSFSDLSKSDVAQTMTKPNAVVYIQTHDQSLTYALPSNAHTE